MLKNPWNRLTGGRNLLIDTRQRSEGYLPCQFSYGNQFFEGSFFLFLFYSGLLPIPLYKIFHFETFKDFPNLSTDLKLSICFLSDRPSHAHSALEPDFRFLLTAQMNSGGLGGVHTARLMLQFSHFRKQPSLWLLSQNSLCRNCSGELSDDVSP